ncbi:DNA repair protein RecO [bacterium HR21]|jgi:DNA repair protein RecO (recombination protein O)|nr:DNA repair protein RecO [bacterium HR21]
MVVESAAVVLRTQRFGDTSLLATLYTQQFGKCTVLAKGARTVGSPHGAALEVPNHIRVAFYRSPRREISLVRTAELTERFGRLRVSLEHMATALLIAESILLTQAPDEPNSVLYALLLQALRGIEQSETPPFGIAVAFLLRLARLLGFAPSLQPLVSEPGTPLILRSDDGALVPPQQGYRGIVLQPAEGELLRTLQHIPLEAAPLLALRLPEAFRLIQGLISYLEHHLERTLRFRSLDLWTICSTSPPAPACSAASC